MLRDKLMNLLHYEYWNEYFKDYPEEKLREYPQDAYIVGQVHELLFTTSNGNKAYSIWPLDLLQYYFWGKINKYEVSYLKMRNENNKIQINDIVFCRIEFNENKRKFFVTELKKSLYDESKLKSLAVNVLPNITEDYRYFHQLIKLSKQKIIKIENHKKEICINIGNGNKGPVVESLYDFTGKKEDIERVKKSLEISIEKCESQINIETDNQRKWNRLLHKVDEILNDYPILQVKLRGEKLHSSMLFLRNRYYRAIYEIIKSHPMIHVYKSINSMPVQKLYTLYEKWCYFKMISIIMEKYGFDIYAFSNIQGQLTEENLRFDESLAILIQSAISDIPCPANDYINIILKKKEYEKQYIKLEYQRVFGDPDSMEKGKKLIPDFCLTFGNKKDSKDNTYDIDGQIFVLDAKYKYYKIIHETDNRYDIFKWIREEISVSLYKYLYSIKNISGDVISGSYILHPVCGKDRSDSVFFNKMNEDYGTNISQNYKEYKQVIFENDKTELTEEKNRFGEMKDHFDSKKIDLSYFARRTGGFGFEPGHDRYISGLFRMILEWYTPFDFSDKKHLLVWNKCLICGKDITEENIIEDITNGGYTKYHLTCPVCGEFWVKTHCKDKYCHEDLIKHIPGHNYLAGNGWFLVCPYCQTKNDNHGPKWNPLSEDGLSRLKRLLQKVAEAPDPEIED